MLAIPEVLTWPHPAAPTDPFDCSGTKILSNYDHLSNSPLNTLISEQKMQKSSMAVLLSRFFPKSFAESTLAYLLTVRSAAKRNGCGRYMYGRTTSGFRRLRCNASNPRNRLFELPPR